MPIVKGKGQSGFPLDEEMYGWEKFVAMVGGMPADPWSTPGCADWKTEQEALAIPFFEDLNAVRFWFQVKLPNSNNLPPVIFPRPLLPYVYSKDPQPGLASLLSALGNTGAWETSSAKPSHGVRQLRDGNPNTYFQTRGRQPHWIDVSFTSLTPVSQVRLDFMLNPSDKSSGGLAGITYVPNKISIWAGSDCNNLQMVGEYVMHDQEKFFRPAIYLVLDRPYNVPDETLKSVALAFEEENLEARVYYPTITSEMSLPYPMICSPGLSGVHGVNSVPAFYFRLKFTDNCRYGHDLRIRQIELYGLKQTSVIDDWTHFDFR